MADNTAISVSNVRKAFKLPHEKQGSIKNIFINVFKPKRNYEKQKVLDDVSFEVSKGEFFGIVGRNGSGKSTLLKLISGIYSPDEGAVAVNGKLTPFIELGVGFNPELTGRENVFLNGALLGFSTKQMEEFYPDIVEFAELERFMDQKLKNYSSGMQVRLAFSIAIKARNEILIFDEVLAVGDEAFQRKCLDTFEKYKAEKQTIILVTHDMETVRKFCNRAMLVDNGKIIEIGNPRSVAEKYSKLNQDIINKSVEKSNSRHKQNQYLKTKLLNDRMESSSNFGFGGTLSVDIGWEGFPASKIESIGVNIFKLSGEHITGINTRDSSHSKDWKSKGGIRLDFKLNITPGRYYVLVEVFEEPGKVVESILEGLEFTINKGQTPWSGLIELPYQWYET
jgi:ABC-type polysaccharide/polyol phosphate transport system ATPase subunit